MAIENRYDVITRINEHYGKMSKGQKAISAFIYDHYDQAVFMTAARLGETVGVSESTVVRYAMFIGYNGYPEFQRDLEDWVQNKINSVQKIGAKYAVDIILEAKTVYVMGVRSCEPLAEFLNFYLNMIRGSVVLLKTTSISETFEQMIRIDGQDAMIGISFPRYSMRTLKAMEFANDRNAKVITVTDSVHSPMNLYSSCNLLARSDMVSIVDSLVAPLSVINALVVAMCLKRPEEVKRSLKDLEEAWNNYQVYLNDEINFIDEEPMLNYPLRRRDGS